MYITTLVFCTGIPTLLTVTHFTNYTEGSLNQTLNKTGTWHKLNFKIKSKFKTAFVNLTHTVQSETYHDKSL